MAGDYGYGDELPSVDHSPLNEGPWEKVNLGKSYHKGELTYVYSQHAISS